MNHPARDLLEEIDWYGQHEFDFVDLALEPPCADPDTIDLAAVKDKLAQYKMDVVIHCAWYLPICSPFATVRRAALVEFQKALTIAQKLEAPLLTTHYMKPPSMFGHKESIAWHIDVLAPLCEEASSLGIKVAIENTPHSGSNQIRNLAAILREIPSLYLHLDSGHAKLEVGTDRFDQYLKKLGDRLIHVHLSENDGFADQHLPLASVPRSRTDWPTLVANLKASGYDGTITLEVFADERRFILFSRDLLQEWWQNA
ncbi:MAG: sugar phosphate isomerase/epimerase family protein [Chloroflexota bacterium]